ncbi:MAG: AAA family ATPase [Spirochaetia bacterium]
MKGFLHHIIWLMRGVTVFALVGRSGTGKSFRAKLVAQKFGIDMIIDDGLVIRDQKIIAGRSAKREKVYLTAIKTALFTNESHCKEVRHALDKEKFKRILILGTSEKMVNKITHRLKLPSPSKVISIEEIASKKDIETAILSRKNEGKHVIPVPTIEIHRNYPQFVYDSVKVLLKRGVTLLPKKEKIFEKTVVQPEFGRKGRVTISESALTQMVLHCVDEYDDTIAIHKVTVTQQPGGYYLSLNIHVPFGVQLSGTIHALRDYIIESLEHYGGIHIRKVDIKVDKLH